MFVNGWFFIALFFLSAFCAKLVHDHGKMVGWNAALDMVVKHLEFTANKLGGKEK